MFHLPDCDHENLSLRLSQVLDDIRVNERILLKWRRSALLGETIRTIVLGYPIYNFGSLSEGTTTIGLQSDMDTLISLNDFNVIQDYAEWKHGCVNLLMIQDDITSPGYCHLQLTKSDEPLPQTDIIDEHCFRDANNRILLKNTVLKDENLRGALYNGPAQTTEGQPGIRDRDLVFAFLCKSWPYEARNWLNRGSGIWPTANMKRFAENSGCFVVPVGSKVSQLEYLEWRISTSKAERCLMFNLNITQVRCYVLLKMILKTYLHHPVSSFMCKTILLHCIENSHPSAWRENNLFTCLSACLQALYMSLIHKNCPHFIIPRNNLMAGQFSPQVRKRLLKSMHYVMESQGHALLLVQIDDLGQRLQIKLNVMYPNVHNVNVRSSEDICQDISVELVKDVEISISDFTINLLLETIKRRQSYETILQQFMQTISNYLRQYREGTKLEQTAVSLVVPLLCSTIGSVLASFNIGTNNSVSPRALSWLSAGLNSDISSGRLKIASVLYCAGDLLRTEFILRETERLYCLDIVEPTCACYDFVQKKMRREFGRVCDNQNEQAIKTVCAFCIRFIPAEINCIPHELQYEFYRSTEDDLLHRDEDDDSWIDLAVVDSLPFLYFLQYKTYGCLQRYDDQQRALTNLVRTIITEENLAHRETAITLLGQCMEQENKSNDALKCYITSLNVRGRNNVARFHICRLLANMINFVP